MFSRFAENIVRACRSKPWATLAVTLVLVVGAAVAAVTTLEVNTDTAALFDHNLPFRVTEREFDKYFPNEVELIVAVIDGSSAQAAQAAADKLAAALSPHTDIFRSIQNPTGGTFFAHNGLLYLTEEEMEDLSGKLSAGQPLLGSIATDRNARGFFRLLELAFQGATAGDKGAEGIAPAAKQGSDVIANVLDGKPARMDWGRLFGQLGPSNLGARAMVLAQPKLDLTALEQGGDGSKLIRDTARELGITPENGLRLRLTGQIPLSDEEFATVAEGTSASGILSVVLVAILLFMALGSGRIVAASLITLVVGLVLTFGWAALTVKEINLISIAFAVMFVGIAVDFAIQFCMRYRAERRERLEQADGLDAALDAAGNHMAKPLALAAAATALGFFSFLPTEYRGVAQLGIIAGGGMIVAVILSFTLLPALLQIFKPGAERHAVGYLWAAPLNDAIVRKRVPVLVVSGLVALISIAALPCLVFNFDPLKLKDPTTESMSTALELMDDPLVNPNTLSVLVKTSEEAKAVAEKVSALPEVAQAVTIFDLIPENQDVRRAAIDDLRFLLGPVFDTSAAKPAPTVDEVKAAAKSARDSADAYRNLPTADGLLKETANQFITIADRLLAQDDAKRFDAVSAALLADFDDAIGPLEDLLEPDGVTMEALPDELRSTYVATDGRYRVQIFPKGGGSDGELLTRFLMSVRNVAPDAFGMPVIIYESGRIVTQAFAVAAGLSLVAITILLFVIMRRARDVARVLAPLLLAGVLTLGTCALTGFKLNFANIIALPLLLGVGVTFPIYFVTAWREGERHLLASPAGRGMLYSALTTAAAFGSLAISKHTGTAAMGLLLTLALVYTLLATLVFLPALLGAPEQE